MEQADPDNRDNRQCRGRQNPHGVWLSPPPFLEPLDETAVGHAAQRQAGQVQAQISGQLPRISIPVLGRRGQAFANDVFQTAPDLRMIVAAAQKWPC